MERLAVTTLVLVLALGACEALPQRENDNFVFPTDEESPVRTFDNPAAALETRLSLRGERRPGSTGVRLNQATVTEPPTINCSWANQSVWYQPSGQCETLFLQGPCAADEWLVVVDNVATCREQQCPDGELMFNGNCEKIKNSLPCPDGMFIKAMETGEAECDCQEGHVYWALTDRCYQLLLRGPCQPHQLLVLPAGSQEARCRANRCKDGQVDVVRKQGRVQLASIAGKCHDLYSRGPCDQVGEILLVDHKAMALSCGRQLIHNRVLINAPLIECSPGSRRSASGQCRRAFK